MEGVPGAGTAVTLVAPLTLHLDTLRMGLRVIISKWHVAFSGPAWAVGKNKTQDQGCRLIPEGGLFCAEAMVSIIRWCLSGH